MIVFFVVIMKIRDLYEHFKEDVFTDCKGTLIKYNELFNIILILPILNKEVGSKRKFVNTSYLSYDDDVGVMIKYIIDNPYEIKQVFGGFLQDVEDSGEVCRYTMEGIYEDYTIMFINTMIEVTGLSIGDDNNFRKMNWTR